MKMNENEPRDAERATARRARVDREAQANLVPAAASGATTYLGLPFYTRPCRRRSSCSTSSSMRFKTCENCPENHFRQDARVSSSLPKPSHTGVHV